MAKFTSGVPKVIQSGIVTAGYAEKPIHEEHNWASRRSQERAGAAARIRRCSPSSIAAWGDDKPEGRTGRELPTHDRPTRPSPKPLKMYIGGLGMRTATSLGNGGGSGAPSVQRLFLQGCTIQVAGADSVDREGFTQQLQWFAHVVGGQGC